MVIKLREIPIHEFTCTNCGQVWEIRDWSKDWGAMTCPGCGYASVPHPEVKNDAQHELV